jgi:putative tryptophan/tyrosine transport system substrate-binding protein
MAVHQATIISSSVRNNVPAIIAGAGFVRDGSLIHMWWMPRTSFRRAAAYVDRILSGERPADLPVQTPTKFDIAINLKTAKTLGLAVPPSLLALVDEVIE